MTDREKAIVTAYTGIYMLEGEKLGVFYQYLEELYGRPVYTHELVALDIKEKSKPDFLQLCKEEQPEPYEELDFVQEHKKIPVVLDIQQKGKSMLSAQPEYNVDEWCPEQRWIPDACRCCANHPSNGGSGICNCTLGSIVWT